MRRQGTGLGCARRIPLNHRSRLPARQLHEVTLGTARGQPGVGESVSQLVWVDSSDPSLGRATSNHLPDAGVGHAPLLPAPQPRELGTRVLGPLPKITIQRLGRFGADRQEPLTSPFAQDPENAAVQVDVAGVLGIHAEVRQLGRAPVSMKTRRIASSRRPSSVPSHVARIALRSF